MSITYTVRYSDDDNQMIRWVVMQCQDEKDAVRTAAAKMLSPYAAVEISKDGRIVWRGSRARVNVWAGSARVKPQLSYMARAS
jgi:hypothetical protein